jgi:replicative DNA helicase
MPDADAGFQSVSFAERDMPHSLETEQALLGVLLVAPDRIGTALETVKPESFFEKQHKELFRLLVDLYTAPDGESADIVVVLNEALRRGIFESEAEGKRYLYAISQDLPPQRAAQTCLRARSL